MYFKDVYLENGKLHILPNHNKILQIILLLIVILITPITLGLIIHIALMVLDSWKAFWEGITLFHLFFFFLYFLLMVSIIGIKNYSKSIPKKIIIDVINVNIDYGNNKIYLLPTSLFTNYLIKEVRTRSGYYYNIFLINKSYNINVELIDTNNSNKIKMITEYLNSIQIKPIEEDLKNIELAYKILNFRNFRSISKLKEKLIFSEVPQKIHIKNRGRDYFSLLLLFLIINIFLFIFIKIFYNDYIISGEYRFGMIFFVIFFFIYMIFYLYVLKQIFLSFFDFEIYVNNNHLVIDYVFFISFFKYRFTKKKFLLIDDSLATVLFLHISRKISFIEFYDSDFITQNKTNKNDSFWGIILKSIKSFLIKTKLHFYGFHWFEILDFYNQINYLCYNHR